MCQTNLTVLILVTWPRRLSLGMPWNHGPTVTVTTTSDSLLSLLDIASLFIATLYVILSSCYLSVPYKDSDFSIE